MGTEEESERYITYNKITIVLVAALSVIAGWLFTVLLSGTQDIKDTQIMMLERMSANEAHIEHATEDITQIENKMYKEVNK